MDFNAAIQKRKKVNYGNLISRAKSDLNDYNDKLDEMTTQADLLSINSDVDYETATAMSGQVALLFKAVESDRKRLIDEPDKYVRAVNRIAKSVKDKLDSIKGELAQKMRSYTQELEMQRREEEKRRQEAIAQVQAEIDKRAEAQNIKPVQLEIPIEPPKKNTVATEYGTTYEVKTWKHEVIDEKLIPRTYLMVDDQAIKTAIRGGIREIPGVRIYEDTQIRTRT